MSWKKEPCRNFQRGSCRYGDQCKFLHVAQQQSRPNPFGFGTGRTVQVANNDNYQSQQPLQPNPYGFGVQSGSQAKGSSAFGPKSQTYAKPFENKWVRGKDSSSEQANTQPRIVDHKCTDPDLCKQIISDDFKHEQPLWKLTCYGHFKGLPCDISGDISYEELRAAAYEEARQGMSLQTIVERERNLLNSKLQEFTSLLQNPYAVSKTSSLSILSQFPNYNTTPTNSQSSLPASALSFGKNTGPATNTALKIRPSFPEGNSSAVGQTSLFHIQNQNFPASSGTSGPVGGLLPGQIFGVFPGSSVNDMNNESQGNLFSASSNISSNLMSTYSQTSTGTVNGRLEDKLTDASIWLKEKWEVKEIPEEEPPPQFCK